MAADRGSEVSDLQTGFEAAIRAARMQVEEQTLNATRSAARELLSAFKACYPGTTAAGNPLWERAIAPWESECWKDGSPSTTPVGVGGLACVGRLSAYFPEYTNEHRSSEPPFPAIVPLLASSNLIIVAEGKKLASANNALQSLVFRLLTSVFPGKLRLTAIDARGLGRNISTCLSLPEKVLGPKVWHEEKEIAEALMELTTAMSGIIRHNLKNDYPNIDQYNREAGEMSEPYRLLLVTNFPAGFRPDTAERLLSIAQNGPRVGVHVIVTVDAKRKPPHDFNLPALLESGTALLEAGDLFAWRGLEDIWVDLDSAPPQDIVDNVVKALNPAVKAHDHVQLDFHRFAPDQPWRESSAEGIRVPIGRKGARDLLCLEFGGSDTAHHALIGGRTGAGKTVLLHILINSLSLHYSPEELELYLIDFKEGVEFQVYRELPHARVVAMQSEREFGVSVLEGLRDELNRRGELFVATGSHQLADWRKKTGKTLPRIVLVADEFQRFFEINDRISSSARSLLDDIARRGRGFGIHMVLATQTVSAMDLEPSTLSQTGVRIALSMSESDSTKILGKDNDQAKYLERPGQAIYNPAGGLAAKNVEFQVAYLSREDMKKTVVENSKYAAERSFDRKPRVFDGNRPASISENRVFVERMCTPVDSVQRWYDLWVGEPTGLQDGHVPFRMRRQSCGNLLIAGNDETKAFYTLVPVVLSAAKQIPPARGHLRILNLTNVDDPLNGLFDPLGTIHEGAIVGSRLEVEEFIDEAYEELQLRLNRRKEERGNARPEAPPPFFLILFGAQRARSLHKTGHRTTEAGARLGEILRKGPDVGVHSVVWIDSYRSFLQILDSADLAEFGGRLLLTGGEAARLLGPQHQPAPPIREWYGLLADEQSDDQLVKVRCYGSESYRWIASALAGQSGGES